MIQSTTWQTLVEGAHELLIQREGMLLAACMLRFEQTKNPLDHQEAERHQARMYELIKRRSPEAMDRLSASDTRRVAT